MALYTIGDLHLSLGLDKPMEVFGEGWSNYVERIREGFAELTAEDVTVLCGDLSWGMSLEESLQDLTFIHELPGKKILTKGNHDYWWNTAAKMQRFFDEHGLDSLQILHNNCIFYENVALWHERDISHSSAERMILPDTTALLDYMLHRFGRILANLDVFPETMKKNMDKTLGLIYSGRRLCSKA